MDLHVCLQVDLLSWNGTHSYVNGLPDFLAALLVEVTSVHALWAHNAEAMRKIRFVLHPESWTLASLTHVTLRSGYDSAARPYFWNCPVVIRGTAEKKSPKAFPP